MRGDFLIFFAYADKLWFVGMFFCYFYSIIIVMEYKYTGIILNKKDIGETDRIYNIYTLEEGKISAIARGVRKPRAKLAGHLENFYLVDLTIMKNRGMGNIASSIVEKNFKELKNDFESLEKVFQAVRIMGRLIKDQERDFKVFFLFLEYLETLNKISENSSINNEQRILINQGFLFKLLDLLGYKLEIGRCVDCQGQLTSENNFFDCNRGGVVCGKCAFKGGNLLSIGNNSIKVIRIFFKNEIKNLLKLKISKRESRELVRVSDSFIKWIC